MNVIKKIINYNKVVEDYKALESSCENYSNLIAQIKVALEEKYGIDIPTLLQPKRKPGRPRKEK